MTSTHHKEISIPQAIYAQLESRAQKLNIPPSDFIAAVLEAYLRQPSDAIGSPVSNEHAALPAAKSVSQGDIFWATPLVSYESESLIPHPYVIIQDDLINHSRIDTVVGCALTTNLRRVSETPGNLLLEAGEGNLPRQSVVEVSKITNIHKAQLGEYIGSLSRDRINHILAGMRFLQASYFSR